MRTLRREKFLPAVVFRKEGDVRCSTFFGYLAWTNHEGNPEAIYIQLGNGVA